MTSIKGDHRDDSRLRLVFDEKVVSYGLAADATFGDIAEALERISIQRFGTPVSIDVTLGFRRP